MFCKKNVVLHDHFVILHLSMLGVDRCCKRQTLFKCHKSQTECHECSKTPGQRSRTGVFVGRSGSNFGPSSTHTHTRLTALFPGLPRSAGTRKVKPIWILLKQETVSGSGISWDICKSAPHSRQIPRQHPTAQFFTGRMPFLPPNQQRQKN